jgi:hypothetical protein
VKARCATWWGTYDEVESTYISHMRKFQSFLKVNVAMENWQWNGTSTNGCPTRRCQDAKNPKPFWPYMVCFFFFHSRAIVISFLSYLL